MTAPNGQMDAWLDHDPQARYLCLAASVLEVSGRADWHTSLTTVLKEQGSSWEDARQAASALTAVVGTWPPSWVSQAAGHLKHIQPEPEEQEPSPEQRERIRQEVEAGRAAWAERFRLRQSGDPVDPESLLVRDKKGRISTYRTAEFALPRSDMLSGGLLRDLSGNLLHYGTQHKEWLAWDDQSHIHAADARDVAGRFVQRYAVAHAEALRLIEKMIEQQARLVTAKLHDRMDAAERALKQAEQDGSVKPEALAKLGQEAKALRGAFSEAWAREMAPYDAVFKRHRGYRDKLWGKRTKADVAGELKTLLATDMADFDARPDWLVCDNGVVVVETSPRVRFPLLPHDPVRLVTRRLGHGVAYDPVAVCLAWLAFLASTIGDEADVTFLRRRIGAALAGVRVKDFINIIGKGDTGKTTFNMVMKALFGSYFTSPDVSVFMQAGDPQPWDLDLCRGARYVYAAEPERHSRFRDGMVKKLTGGDPVESARKYGHPVVWDPQCLLVFNTNDPIWFDTADTAMFGRAKPVEFTYSGPKDPALLARLLAELPGIFTWALQGLHEYLIEGIPEVSPSMAALRERIAAESDPALRFLAEVIGKGYLAHDKARTVPASGCVKVSAVYPKFTAWCAAECVRPVAGKQAFNKRVGRIYPQQSSDGERFLGLLEGPRFHEPFWQDQNHPR